MVNNVLHTAAQVLNDIFQWVFKNRIVYSNTDVLHQMSEIPEKIWQKVFDLLRTQLKF